jgi:hypothetical protein
MAEAEGVGISSRVEAGVSGITEARLACCTEIAELIESLPRPQLVQGSPSPGVAGPSLPLVIAYFVERGTRQVEFRLPVIAAMVAGDYRY